MPEVRAIQNLTMRWCLDCHRDPEGHLRPLDRISDMEWNPTEVERREIGRRVRSALDVSPSTNCTTCHR
jgi:hypothetical protein